MAPSVLSASVYLRSHASIAGKHVNVGMMTSGGLAPCLSSSVSQLAKYWIQALEEGKISGLTLRMYVDGYAGVLTGDSFIVPESEWKNMEKLNFLGGSPIGNSRVKVSSRNNHEDAISALQLGFEICCGKFSTCTSSIWFVIFSTEISILIISQTLFRSKRFLKSADESCRLRKTRIYQGWRKAS